MNELSKLRNSTIFKVKSTSRKNIMKQSLDWTNFAIRVKNINKTITTKEKIRSK